MLKKNFQYRFVPVNCPDYDCHSTKKRPLPGAFYLVLLSDQLGTFGFLSHQSLVPPLSGPPSSATPVATPFGLVASSSEG